MEDAVNVTRSNNYQKALATNSTDASFPTCAATITAPALAITLGTSGPGGHSVPSTMCVVPYGVGADNTTFKIRVIGWRLMSSLYVPTILAQYTCTNSTSVGVAGQSVVATERFVDTLTADAMNPSGGVEAVSTANNTPAHFIFDTKGCPLIEFAFDMNSSATSANALVAPV